MVGSGIYVLPFALAAYGGISLFGWILTAVGATLLSLVFARLARRNPAAGGPYAYTRTSFGDFAGFLVAWGYWISIWCGNAAIAVAFASPALDFARAIDEYNAFAELLRGLGMEVSLLPEADGVGLASIYVRDATVMCDQGAILCSMGKMARRDEPAAQEGRWPSRGFP